MDGMALPGGRVERTEGGDRERAGARSVLVWLLAAVWLTIAAGLVRYGFDYYRTPLQERPFRPEHALLAPTGPIGQGMGIAGAAMMAVGVGMYALRKRWALLARTGRLRSWLRVHIFLCTLGPFLVLLHTTLKFGGIVSIAFWSMTLVVLSGVFGRYVYVRVPRTIHGHAQTLQMVEARRAAALSALHARTGIVPAEVEALIPPRAAPGLAGALVASLRFDVERRRRARAARRLLDRHRVRGAERDAVVRLIEEEFRLAHQMRVLQPLQRLFHYWHVFHLPLAIVMFAILAMHVAVAAIMGYGWPF